MRGPEDRVTSFSYRSLMPSGAGTPRNENSELQLCAANSHGEFCHAQARRLQSSCQHSNPMRQIRIWYREDNLLISDGNGCTLFRGCKSLTI